MCVDPAGKISSIELDVCVEILKVRGHLCCCISQQRGLVLQGLDLWLDNRPDDVPHSLHGFSRHILAGFHDVRQFRQDNRLGLHAISQNTENSGRTTELDTYRIVVLTDLAHQLRC